jgi:ATP-dependent DNA helicase HFM1/MER3
MNEKCPNFFQRRPVYVCFVAETSDGCLIDFRRIRFVISNSNRTKAILTIFSANKLEKSLDILLSAELKFQNQYISCHVMCDEIGMLQPQTIETGS